MAEILIAPSAMLALAACAGTSPAAPAGGSGTALSPPASYQGELPGAGGPIRWHLDLLPGGPCQLRRTDLDRPDAPPFDQIGRWALGPGAGKLELRTESGEVLHLALVGGGTELRVLDRAGYPIEPAHNHRLALLPHPSLIEPRLTLAGTFTYLADAASITLCADGRRLPVAMEGDYPRLERAYLGARAAPGEALLVQLAAHIAPRPAAEEGAVPRTAVVVERFLAVWPGEQCGDELPASPLRGTTWQLTHIGGAPAAAGASGDQPFLVLAADDLRVSGSGGCNRLTGPFELDGQRLRFGAIAATRMACPGVMDQERRVLEALRRVRGYRLGGRRLTLLDEAGAMVLDLEATP